MRRDENADYDDTRESSILDRFRPSGRWTDWNTRVGGWGTGLRGWGWMPLYQQDDTRDTVPDDDSSNEGVVTAQGGDGSRAIEGIATLLLIAGFILFLFPEPASSLLGIALILVGAVLWLIDALM